MSINDVVSASWLSYLFTIESFLSCPFTNVESKLVYWELLYAVILLQYHSNYYARHSWFL